MNLFGNKTQEKLAAALRLVNTLEMQMVVVEGDREDTRAIENCYKLKLKRCVYMYV